MNRFGRYGVLNIVLHPHPESSYRNLFERAAASADPVKYFGERFAKISPLSETREGVFTGKVATWLEINTEGNLIEKATLNEILFSEANIEIPSGIGFNSRVFSFAFRQSDHKLYIELINDENEKISIGAAQKIFSGILGQVLDGHEELNVHVVSTSSSVEYVLKTPHLRRLEIEVELPNPDVLTEKKGEVIAALELMKAKKMRIELTRKAGEETMVPTPGVEAFAELASENGYAKATGRSDDGNVVERNTKDFPLEVDLALGVDESRAIAARRAAAAE